MSVAKDNVGEGNARYATHLSCFLLALLLAHL